MLKSHIYSCPTFDIGFVSIRHDSIFECKADYKALTHKLSSAWFQKSTLVH